MINVNECRIMCTVMELKKKLMLIFLVLVMVVGVIFFNNKRTDGLCVLGYHGVVSDEEKKTLYKDDVYTLAISDFERHMKYLYDHGYKTYTMDEVYQYMMGDKELDEKAVVLTFDDGYKNFNEYVVPVTEKYNMHATCFVIGKHMYDDKEKFLKEEDMINSPYASYYSHSYNLHRKSKNGFDRKIIEDLSLEEIDKDFKTKGADASYFAFPYGRSVEGIENILKDNHVKLAFSYNQFRHMNRKDNIYYLPRYMIVDMMPDIYLRWVLG